MKRYDGSVAVVTGASSGIGRQIARDLASRGASVVGIARRSDLLETLRDELEAFHSGNDVVVCDVANADEFTRVLADVEQRRGRVDVLINNAGVEQPTPMTTGSSGLAPYREMMATNYFATVAGTLAILPGMLQRGTGVIANVSSDVVRAPEPRESAYAASKAAVSAFTESVAHEVADRGVRLHVVYPAWVPTAMGMSGINSDDRLPPKQVRRTAQQVSAHVLERLGNERIEINVAWLPLLAPIGRTFAPKLYQRGVRKATARP
jgi:short-subunit dehydrogenase